MTRQRPGETAHDSVATQPTLRMEVPERPALPPGVQLFGELQGTGFTDRQWLIQRNGRFVQVTELLYQVVAQADGKRTIEEIASRVTESIDRLVSPDQVRLILRTVLIPRGLVAAPVGLVSHTNDRVRSPLALNIRMRLVSPRLIDPIANLLQVLYAPPVLIPLLIAIALAHGWVYLDHGVGSALRAALYTPGALAILLALLILSGIFHEFGHAAALRYSGARSRGMGVGVYVVYPVFYTDVTDSYRLHRWARVRTDLGGFYFHLIFALGMVGATLVSGQEFLLLAVPLIDVAIIRQCLPFVRLDGYWVLADLTGIPDLFSLMGPFVRTVLRGRSFSPGGLPPLKRWVKVVFVAYLLATVPALALLYIVLVANMPQLIATTLDALDVQTTVLSRAWAASDPLGLLVALTQMLLLALPLVGLAYMLYATSRRLIKQLWTWSKPMASRRIAALLATLCAATLVAFQWAPQLSTVIGLEPDGVEHITVADRSHVYAAVSYAQDPPVGGAHSPMWQNCGFYDSPVENELAVHSLEHGAVWITFRPDLSEEQVAVLRQLAHTHTHVLVSSYPGLPSAVVASAWGRQLRLDSAREPRLAQFARAVRRAAQTPEPGAPCSGGVGWPR